MGSERVGGGGCSREVVCVYVCMCVCARSGGSSTEVYPATSYRRTLLDRFGTASSGLQERGGGREEEGRRERVRRKMWGGVGEGGE